MSTPKADHMTGHHNPKNSAKTAAGKTDKGAMKNQGDHGHSNPQQSQSQPKNPAPNDGKGTQAG